MTRRRFLLGLAALAVSRRLPNSQRVDPRYDSIQRRLDTRHVAVTASGLELGGAYRTGVVVIFYPGSVRYLESV